MMEHGNFYKTQGKNKPNKSKKLTKDDLVEGEIYYSNSNHTNDYYFIFKFDRLGTGKTGDAEKDYIYTKYQIGYFNHEYFFDKKGLNSAHHNNLRLATQEEKDWLNACIKANKFIPKEEALNQTKSNNSLPTDEELLEYANKHFIVGTKFISNISDEGRERKCQFYNPDRDTSFEWKIVTRDGDRRVYCNKGMFTRDINNENVCSNPYIYSDKDGWCKITYDASIKSEEFVLPDKWCVNMGKCCGSESDIVIKYIEVNFAWKYKVGSNYVCETGFYSKFPSGYTEITFDQFKKYVLKENNNETKMELKTNVWYKHNNKKYYTYRTGPDNNVGFDRNNWVNYISCSNPREWKEAPIKEVEELLINEAKRRYPVGTKVKSLGGTSNATIFSTHFNIRRNIDNLENHANCLVYSKGKWAEIVEDAEPKSHPSNVQNFQIGEELYLIDNKNMNAKLGAKCKVTNNTRHYLDVKWLDTKSNGQMDGGYNYDMFSRTNPLKEKKPNYKVGDFVITKGYSNNYDGRILEIIKIDRKRFCYFRVHDNGYYYSSHNFGINDIARKATQDEITSVVNKPSNNSQHLSGKAADYFSANIDDVPISFKSFHNWHQQEMNIKYHEKEQPIQLKKVKTIINKVNKY